MKAKTIRLTVRCDYCGLPLTYRKEETKQAAKDHLHTTCRKAKDTENKNNSKPKNN